MKTKIINCEIILQVKLVIQKIYVINRRLTVFSIETCQMLVQFSIYNHKTQFNHEDIGI